MPTQKFRGAHSPFAFQLHVPQRKRAPAGGNDQSALAAQNFAWLAAEIDKRCGKDFQVLSADLRKRARPRIEAANFSLDYFRRFGPINFPVFPLQLWRISRKRIVLRSAGRDSRGDQAQRFEQRFRCDLRQPIVQRSTRIARQDVARAL